MGQETLYLKWRPRDFDDVVGQAHVTRTLRNACLSGRIAHAYLFAGPRGTGKTSVARILAKALNCLAPAAERPCNKCHVCTSVNQGRFLDLIEIDGASNRGIDEIRDLREKVGFRPNEGTYKVYIIDEVHMLTREAFNALLKTLEEPPEYVIFVFATTEVWRIPATIRSRCQRFDFRPIRLEMIESRLRQICESENIGRDDRALAVIARQATGSLRDAIGMLDQIASIGEGMVTAELVRSVLGTAPDEAAEQLLGFLLDDDLSSALELLSQLTAEGFDMRQFSQDFLQITRALMLARLGVRPEADVPGETLARLSDMAQGLPVESLLALTRLAGVAAEQVRHGQLPQLPLELALVEASGRLRPGEAAAGAPPAQAQRQAPPRQALPATQSRGAGPTPRAEAAPLAPVPRPAAAAGQPPVASAPRAGDAAITLDRLRKQWPKVEAKVRQRDRTLQALLRSSRPDALDGGTVAVAFTYPYHCACLADGEAREILLAALKDVTGEQLAVTCGVVAPGAKGGAAIAPAPEQPAAEPRTPLPVEQDPLFRDAIDMGGRIRTFDSGGPVSE